MVPNWALFDRASTLMCGIAGSFTYADGPGAPRHEELRRLSAALTVRGPDASGYWETQDGRLRFAHRRLAIIDLSASGNQPFVDAECGNVLVFNGEIYNFCELRRELIKSGHTFQSDGDSEVILKGYREWGEGVLVRLRGMFAFALWDTHERRLLLSRDPYGIKPLYYVDRGGCFAFASQVRPLREHVLQSREPDPAGIVGFLLMGSVPEPRTMQAGIRAVPAGTVLSVSAQGVSLPRPFASVGGVWAMAAKHPEKLDADAFAERVRSAVAASVAAHRVADVPVGAFLSAGIDSGALVGFMAENPSAVLQTMTLGFEDFRGGAQDEVTQAEAMACRYGTTHQTAWIDDSEVMADLPRVLEDMDQPSVDGVNTWLVSKHAARLGLKVVVSGVGGDELFGGYRHFTDLPRWRDRLQRAAKIPGLLPLAASAAHWAHRFGWVHAKAEGLARLGKNLSGLYLVRRGLFMPWELSQFLDDDLLREGLAALKPPDFLPMQSYGETGRDYATIAALEAGSYLRNQLLRDSDWASMAHSLELRTPLVDYQLLQELAPILAAPRPVGMEGKRALALAPRPVLPDTVLNRPKSGFALPMDRWITRTEALAKWRQQPFLDRKGTPWARRMAYALLANQFPDAIKVPG